MFQIPKPPDVRRVLVLGDSVVCLNDVVDPETHWKLFFDEIPLPYEATPALFDESRSRWFGWLCRSMIVRFMRKADAQRRLESPQYLIVDGRRWPVFLSPESEPSIEALMDYDSPQWRWLRFTFRQLRDSVEADGARFALVIVPLSYQLEPDYPFLPQRLFARYCESEGIPCLDALPALRSAGRTAFLGSRPDWGGREDIWHLSERGHEVVAQELAGFVLQQHLFDGYASPQPRE